MRCVALHIGAHTDALNLHTAFFQLQGQIYEREEIAKYLEKEGNAVTREKFKSKDLVPLVHVRNTIEHLVESGIIEGELADTWKGRMTEKRDGEKEAEKMMRKAEEGDTDAMFELSMAYTRGCHGLKQDFEEAYKWAKKLADSYDAKGMGIAGIMLTIGHGTKANLSEGLILIASSAQQGCTGACSFLAEAYYEGNYGLTKNLRTARYWIEKGLAALGGDYDTGNTDKMHEILRGIEVLEAADTENDANRSDNDGDDN